ncbi:MAG: hypothetical protein IPK55_13520 [Streptococcus sp.]|nr:hypothetical protein [Streptococcus sp.]
MQNELRLAEMQKGTLFDECNNEKKTKFKLRQDIIRKWQSTVLSFLKKRSFLLEYLVLACLGGVDTLQMPISCTKDIWIEHFLQIETTREETLSTGNQAAVVREPEVPISNQ